MATGYKVELGYNSGALGDASWEDLKSIAISICDNPLSIFDEARAYGAPEHLVGEDLIDYANAYKTRDDLTIVFEDDEEMIFMMASGGYPARTMKEHCKHAFIRLLMQSMHRKGVGISIVVS